MRRRALIVVEYGTESGRPIDAEVWEQMLRDFANFQQVQVEVLEDEPA